MRRLTGMVVAWGLALVAASCFDDPTSALRKGPARLHLTRSSIVVRTGDSTDVEARVLDSQGNPLPFTGATWASSDQAVAAITIDSREAVGAVYSRAFIRGVAAEGGVTNVTVQAEGLTAVLRVTVLSARFAGAVSVTGTPSPDTIVVQQPAPTPPLSIPVTGGDTLTLAAPSTMTFDETNSTVLFGVNSAYILSRTATSIKAMARGPFAGRATVTDLTFAGNAETGPIEIASIETDSILIVRGRFRGAVSVAASAFGPNTEMTLTAPAGVTFNTSGATASGVVIGSTNAIVLSRTTTGLTAIVAATLDATVKVTNVNVGGVLVDSLRTATATAINASFFPGSVDNGAGRLLDTVVVSGDGQATFTTSGASASQVTINGAPAFVLSRTADELRVIAKLAGTAQVSISNVIVAGTTIPSLSTQSTLAVSTTTGEVGEPGNDNPGGVGVVVEGTTVSAPLVIHGASTADGNGVGPDADDFFTFTLTAQGSVVLKLEFAGNGSGSGATNPDLDLLACNAACSAFVGGFGGATVANPENLTLSNLAAGTYHIWVNGWNTGSQPVTYKLTAYQP